MSRSLLVLRHTKSSWDAPSVADHDRPLAPRGHHAGALLQRELADRELPIELVLCSTALRTRQTLAAIRDGLPSTVEVIEEPRLYAATAMTLLARLREVAPTVGGVLLVGHNPGVQDLVELLVADGDPGARRRVAAKYPTGGLAELAVPGPWPELAWRSCALTSFVVPRDLG